MSKTHKNIKANPNNTLITSTVRNAFATKNIQNNIAIIHIAGNIHRLLIHASFALNQSMNKNTHLIIAQIHRRTTAIDAIASQISGMQRSRNHAISVIIEIIKSIFL